MNTLLRRPVRAGLLLSTLVALLAFAARLAEAQSTHSAAVPALVSPATLSPASPSPTAR